MLWLAYSATYRPGGCQRLANCSLNTKHVQLSFWLPYTRLHYAAQLTIRPVGDFENSGHHFPAAESALLADDKPPADVHSPSYHSSGLLRM